MADQYEGGFLMPEEVDPDARAGQSATSIHDVKIIDDLEEALEDMTEAMSGYEKARQYYEGEVTEKFISPAVQKLLSGSSTDFNINLAARVVTAVLDRMEIVSVTAEPLEDGEDEDEPDTDDEVGGQEGEDLDSEDEMSEEEKILDEAIAKIWRDNQMDIESPEIHEKMLEFGDAYLFVGVGEDDAGNERVDLFYNSPLNVRVLYDEENPRKKRLAIKRWCVGSKKNEKVRLNLYYPEGTYKFITNGKTKGTNPSEFVIFTDDDTDEKGFVPNDTGEIPFFHFRTARPYGRPEHLNAYGSQDAVTKLVANQMDTSDFTAFPQRWALQESGTMTDDDLDWGTNSSDQTDEADPNNLQSQLISGPGKIWPLRNMKAVGQFDAADVEQFIKPINMYVGLMAATTGTPISYLQQTLGSLATPASGESQRKGESPLITKTNKREASAEATWSDALGYALKLQDLTGEVKVRWAPNEVVSGESGWKAVQEQQKAGVPVRQTLLEAGYSEAEVTSWGYTEDNPDGPGMDLSSLVTTPPGTQQQAAALATPGAPVQTEAPLPPATPAATPAETEE